MQYQNKVEGKINNKINKIKNTTKEIWIKQEPTIKIKGKRASQEIKRCEVSSLQHINS